MVNTREKLPHIQHVQQGHEGFQNTTVFQDLTSLRLISAIGDRDYFNFYLEALFTTKYRITRIL